MSEPIKTVKLTKRFKRYVQCRGMAPALNELYDYFDDRLFGGVRMKLILESYRQEVRNLSDDNIFDFVFSTDSSWVDIRPRQDARELRKLIYLVSQRRPRRVLEIGTFNGGTFFLFGRVASSDATLVSVDLPPSLFNTGYPKWRETIYRSFAKEQQKIELIRGDSHADSTFQNVRTKFDGEIDFAFIDGDHSYEGVKKDFEMYSPLVKKGGLISFHDVIPRTDVNIGVPRFWEEVKTSYRYHEFLDGGDKGGIGVLEF